MSHQSALTIIDEIKPDQVESLKTALGTIAAPGPLHDAIAFSALGNVHFARLVVFDQDRDLDGNPLPPKLALLTNFDGDVDAHIGAIAGTCGGGLDAVFSACVHYPEQAAVSAARREQYLRRHRVKEKALYVNRQGRTVSQILREKQLRDEIQRHLDAHPIASQSPAEVHRAIVSFVKDRSDLDWALEPEVGPSELWKRNELVHRWAGLALAVLLAPVFLISLPIFLLVLRYHEKRDVPDDSAASAESVRAFRADEDIWVHNQIIAVGVVKPGLFRRLLTEGMLKLTDYAARHIYNRGFLSGLNTIHFARWVPMDDDRRLFFSSNYDGSLESYMNDFIDKAAWGLNAIFSNGDGFPRTCFMFCGGITDEKAYKRFLPTRQVHSRVWYSAYPDLTTKNIANNAEIREGLSQTMSEAQAADWLLRLGVGNRLPASGFVARLLDSIRWDRICRNCS